MKVEIERGAFAEIVGGAAKALAARPAAPTLAGLLLTADAEAGTLRAAAFDFELAVRATAPARVGESGTVLVSGKLLAEITRVLPDVPVELVLEGGPKAAGGQDGAQGEVATTGQSGHLVLACGAYRYTLTCMPVQEYPALPDFPESVGTVSGAALATAAARVAMAAERDDALPFLTGARLEFGPAYLRMVSTDRYRLARVDVPWQLTEAVGAGAEAAALVPARALSEAAKLLPGAEQVCIGLGDGRLGLAVGGLELTLRQLDGEFIRYAQLFPDEYAGEAVLDVAALTEAVRAIALVAERHTPVRLELTPGQVKVSAGSGDHALADVTVEVGYEGEPVVIAANPAFLLDGLGALGTAYARLRFPAKIRPVFLSPLAEPTGTTGGGGTGTEADALFHYLFIPSRGAERG
ncbi:DNA polymerase III subunit beta [Actinospica robiniae]|uniref:DNA polymerase III subunit beta n=1 Tax=Actinospica robiniae TaxID=304901 RepID=UPI0003FE2F05|nr:DNA polymerase III subunit beta [Actinospica robiniae]